MTRSRHLLERAPYLVLGAIITAAIMAVIYGRSLHLPEDVYVVLEAPATSGVAGDSASPVAPAPPAAVAGRGAKRQDAPALTPAGAVGARSGS
jgi:hypothetical protein